MKPIPVTQAFDTIMANVPPPAAESVDLTQATGRILLEPVTADRDYPPIHRATMDGIALSIISWRGGTRKWTIENTIAAGVAATPLKDPLHHCVKIMTGAEIPSGCSGIIPFEQVTIRDGFAEAQHDVSFDEGQFIHVRASDQKAGALLLSPGVMIDAPRMAILAAVGHTPVKVARRPRVAVISTGNEIVPVTRKNLTAVQSRASNAAGLAAALELLGIAGCTLTHISDDLDATKESITHALQTHDVVILSGGVSKGEFDYVPAALKTAGVVEIFHGVAQKPGKPFWFGRSPTTTVFGLPGNPVSTLTVFRRYVAPFICSMSGATPGLPLSVQLTHPIQPHKNLTTFPPVRLTGQNTVEPVEYHGSGDFAALAKSSGFLEIPAGSEPVSTRDKLAFWAW